MLNDDEVELNETIALGLANVTNAFIGPAATLTILDDDRPQVAFLNGSYQAGEGDSTATITLRLNAASGQAVTVWFLATNGTASALLDYLPASGMVLFAPGQVQRSFPVTLLEDQLDERTETVLLSLMNPTNAVLGTLASSVLNILDNDPPTVNFAQPQFNAVESAGSVAIHLLAATTLAAWWRRRPPGGRWAEA